VCEEREIGQQALDIVFFRKPCAPWTRRIGDLSSVGVDGGGVGFFDDSNLLQTHATEEDRFVHPNFLPITGCAEVGREQSRASKTPDEVEGMQRAPVAQHLLSLESRP
jgi:hypothetical protein